MTGTKRRTWKYLFVMLLLAAVAWVGSESLQKQRQPLGTLEAVVDQEAKTGWRVARPPELPGPYRRGEHVQYVARGSVGSMTITSPNGPVSIRLGVKDDVEQMIVPLRTADGSLTAAVLER